MNKKYNIVNFYAMAKATGIPGKLLKMVLNGEFSLSAEGKAKSVNKKPELVVNTSKRLVYIEKKISLQEQIESTEEISELYEILESTGWDIKEYILVYEKLTSLISIEIAKTDDEGELGDLIKYIPLGSPEETEITDKIISLEISRINEENDFDELVNIFQNEELYTKSLEHLVKRILAIADSHEQTKQLIDNVFDDNSEEYYLTCQRHCELIKDVISKMTEVDEADDIYNSIISEGSDEEILLAKKIVQIAGDDYEQIWGKNDIFSDYSESKEILAIAVINLCTAYSDDTNNILDSVLEAFEEKTRVGRMAIKQKKALLMSHATSLTDINEIKSIIDEFKDGDLSRQLLENRIVELADDCDELIELENNEGPYCAELARKKLDTIILDKAKNERSLSNLDDLETYAEEDSIEEGKIDERRVELCSSYSEAESLNIENNSYAEYMLAKKFGGKTKAAPIIISESASEIPEVNESQPEEVSIEPSDSVVKDINSKQNNLSKVMMVYKGLPEGSIDKQYVYSRASKLLKNQLSTAKKKEEIIQLLDLFPRLSEEWILILDKLTTFYPAPKWMFWKYL